MLDKASGSISGIEYIRALELMVAETLLVFLVLEDNITRARVTVCALAILFCLADALELLDTEVLYGFGRPSADEASEFIVTEVAIGFVFPLADTTKERDTAPDSANLLFPAGLDIETVLNEEPLARTRLNFVLMTRALG